MREALRYVLTIIAGTAIGGAFAIHTVRAGALGATTRIGPWQTGRDFGTADAHARTRAIVAWRGLLALPAREARYYTATTDSTGRPLRGRCRYEVTGLTYDKPGEWWSLTLYDPDGHLVPNPRNIFSVESAAIPPSMSGRWTITVRPQPQPLLSLPTGGLDRFQLTLRAYLPRDGGRADPPASALPTITSVDCH